MTLSMYQASVPVFIHMLENLSAIMKKAQEHAEAKKIDPSVLINARLYPDMFPLSRQIQIVSDTVKGGAARLAGVEIPSFEDNETTFPQLQERIAKTISFLKTINASAIDGTEAKSIVVNARGKETTYVGQPFLINYVLPNLYFHTTVAYAILRHNGVEVGKKDYLGKVS